MTLIGRFTRVLVGGSVALMIITGSISSTVATIPTPEPKPIPTEFLTPPPSELLHQRAAEHGVAPSASPDQSVNEAGVPRLSEDDLNESLATMPTVELESEPAPQVMRSLARHKSEGDVKFTGRSQIGQGWPPNGVIAVGDWDRNGWDDLMLIRDDGTLWLYPATSSTRFAQPRQLGHGWQTLDMVAGGFDWNGDGYNDLIARTPEGYLRAYYGSQSGRFNGYDVIGWGWSRMITIIPLPSAVGGKPGIAAIDRDGVLYSYRSNGRGAFLGSNAIGGGWGSMKHVVAAGDWNHSGRSGLLAVDAQGNLLLYASNITGLAFSRYRIGWGWGFTTHISAAHVNSSSANVRAVFPDRKLFNYSVNLGASTPTDALVPGASMPWTAKGWTYVARGSAAGAGLGSTIKYQVEVEAGLPVYVDIFAQQVHQILNDKRGWRRNFQRVSSGGNMRLILASPALVDKLCAPLKTRGYTSCRRGNMVIINVHRWAYNAQPFAAAGGNLSEYRNYVINHETGHYLGHGHLQCPGPGRLAPVMQQQTLFVQPCRPNGWPNP